MNMWSNKNPCTVLVGIKISTTIMERSMEIFLTLYKNLFQVDE
jgi:hypothetical protein